MVDQRSYIAHHRFGYGLAPDEQPTSDPKGWLVRQLAGWNPAVATSPGNPAELVSQMQAAADADMRRDFYDAYRARIADRVERARTTQTPFVERLVNFWSNHFAVSADTKVTRSLAPDYEDSAIRPHVTGKFADLLLAAETHPAMLVFLDQSRSVGPNSKLGKWRSAKGRRNSGINENLAREIMELHTMGVRSGYTQADVIEFAKALTGYTVAGLAGGAKAMDDSDVGGFVFDANRHEPGARVLMGKSYPPGEANQARAMLLDIAAHESTARFIATKLARHFIADDPPADSVNRIADAFHSSGGDLKATYRALIDEDAAWQPGMLKYKSPWDWTVSALRTAGVETPKGNFIATWLGRLGQSTWEPGSPAGFPDVQSEWLAPDGLIKRADLAKIISLRKSGAYDPRDIAGHAFGDQLGDAARGAVAAAGDKAQGLSLLLMSRDFQWR